MLYFHCMIQPFLTVAPSGSRGRGVFTTEDIPANTIVEMAPVLVLSKKERQVVEQTKLNRYIFEWGVSKTKGALALGFVSMYNHEYNANCEYEMDFAHELITIRTVGQIKKGEELSINYNAHPDDPTEVWF